MPFKALGLHPALVQAVRDLRYADATPVQATSRVETLCTMTDEQLAAMHRLLAEYHRRLAKEAVLDVVQQYHSDLAQRLSDEAVLIPRRTTIVERLREREQQTKDDGE